MLGSEVIKQIQNLIDEYGDLPIENGKFSNKLDRKYITLLSFIQ